jgi:hypothetical protein
MPGILPVTSLVEEFEEFEEFELFGSWVRRILRRRDPMGLASQIVDLVCGWSDSRLPVR